MAEQLNVAMIQMQVGKSLSDNLAVARQKCGEATALDAELIVLPEYFADMYGVGADPRDADHPPQSVELDSICTTLSEIAAQHKVTIHGGSFLERDGDHVYNTNPVYGPDGKLVTTYRKQHPFHCPVVPRGSGNAEIDFITPGQTVSTYEIRGFRIGCAICWDTRFPELFAAYRQAGCDLILCPAVFFAEVPTDIAFWESLTGSCDRHRLLHRLCNHLRSNRSTHHLVKLSRASSLQWSHSPDRSDGWRFEACRRSSSRFNSRNAPPIPS